MLRLVGQLLILIKSVMFESVCHCHQDVIDSVQRRDFFAIVAQIMAYFHKLLLIPVLIVLVVVTSLFVTPVVCTVQYSQGRILC